MVTFFIIILCYHILKKDNLKFIYIINSILNIKAYSAKLDVTIETNKNKNREKPAYSMFKSIVMIIVSIIIIAFSSDLIVDNAVVIAESLGISHKVITMVIIVIGTSLPELTMTVRCAKKHEFDIALGNIIGTNIFNICIVLGLPVAIFGNVRIVDFGIVDFIILVSSSIILYIFARTDKELNKTEGIVMFLIFICYYAYILIV